MAAMSPEDLLLSFTNIDKDIVPIAMQAALDMSFAFGSDAKFGVVLLGKALNDPVRNLAILIRSGVTFTRQQKDQIKALAGSGQILKAQKEILQVMNKEFGTSAEQ